MNEYDLLPARELYVLYWRERRIRRQGLASSAYPALLDAFSERRADSRRLLSAPHLCGRAGTRELRRAAYFRHRNDVYKAREAIRMARRHRNLFPNPLP